MRQTLERPDLSQKTWDALIGDYNNKRLTEGWPRQTNDWAAYYPGKPSATVILIPHPPEAGKQFWTRSKGPRGSKPGRRMLYKRVARWFWVCGVLRDEA